MHCTNCGKELVGTAKFCDGCGSPVISGQVEKQVSVEEAPANHEVQENKVIFILSYILFFLPLISCPGSKIGRFHANQGLVLLITSIVGQIAVTILSSILLSISLSLWAITSLLYWVWVLAVVVLVIMGMIHANKGEQKPLPVIGKITIIK